MGLGKIRKIRGPIECPQTALRLLPRLSRNRARVQLSSGDGGRCRLCPDLLRGNAALWVDGGGCRALG